MTTESNAGEGVVTQGPKKAIPLSQKAKGRSILLTPFVILGRAISWIVWTLLLVYSLSLAANLRNLVKAGTEGRGRFWSSGKLQYFWWIVSWVYIVSPALIWFDLIDLKLCVYLTTFVIGICTFTVTKDLTGGKAFGIACLIALILVAIGWFSDHYGVPVFNQIGVALKRIAPDYNMVLAWILFCPVLALSIFDHYYQRTFNYVYVDGDAIEQVEDGLPVSSGRIFRYTPIRTDRDDRGKRKINDPLELIMALAGSIELKSSSSRIPSIHLDDVAGYPFIITFFFRLLKSVKVDQDSVAATASDDDNDDEDEM